MPELPPLPPQATRTDAAIVKVDETERVEVMTSQKRRRGLKVFGVTTALTLVLVLGGGGGWALSRYTYDPTSSSEYHAVKDQLDEQESDLTSAKDDRDEAESDLASALEDLPEREAAVEAAEADVAEREQEVASAETDVTAREEAVGVHENEVAANTFDGDGVYIVGEDIQPGTYRSNGGNLCYWERLSGLSGEFSDLIANDLPAGPTVVEIRASDEAFSTNDCADWTLAD